MSLICCSGVILPCFQAPEELRLFNMQEQQKQQMATGTMGVLNQVGDCVKICLKANFPHKVKQH